MKAMKKSKTEIRADPRVISSIPATSVRHPGFSLRGHLPLFDHAALEFHLLDNPAVRLSALPGAVGGGLPDLFCDLSPPVGLSENSNQVPPIPLLPQGVCVLCVHGLHFCRYRVFTLWHRAA